MLKKHSVFYLILFLAMLFEATSGVLRYFFDMVGLGSIVYLPKIMMFFAVILSLFIFKFSIKMILFWIILLWYLFYSLLNVPILSILFGFYMLLPLFFGFIYANNYSSYRNDLFKLLKIIFILTVFGVWLDFFIDVPWQGYMQSIAGIDIEASRQWTTMGIERPAGFTRLSAAAAIIIAISSIFYIFSLKKSYLQFFIFILSFFTIAITTNKATLLAYILSSPLLITLVRKYFMTTSIIIAIVVGISLPLLAIFFDLTIDINNPIEALLLASFQDRLLNTWPNTYESLMYFSNNNLLVDFFGIGIGGFGTSSKFFGHGLGVADNSWLYIYSLSGFIGIFLMFYCAFIAIRINKIKDQSFVVFSVVLNLILWIGVTTDFYESLIPLFLVGYITFLSRKEYKLSLH